MQTTKIRFKRAFFLLVAVLLSSCSSYRMHRLDINGNQEHLFTAKGCKLSLRVIQTETIGRVALQFQLSRGMTVHLNALKLTLDDQAVAAGKLSFRYAKKQHQVDFTADKPGTFTVLLDKALIAGRTRLRLMPSEFITCASGNAINESVEVELLAAGLI